VAWVVLHPVTRSITSVNAATSHIRGVLRSQHRVLNSASNPNMQVRLDEFTTIDFDSRSVMMADVARSTMLLVVAAYAPDTRTSDIRMGDLAPGLKSIADVLGI